jgi:phosphoribosylformylglycinamidine synthase subunit PurSL
LELDLGKVPAADHLSDTRMLYSESAGRFVVTVNPAKRELFERILSGCPVGLVGVVTTSPFLRVSGSRQGILMEEDVLELKETWRRPFGGLI